MAPNVPRFELNEQLYGLSPNEAAFFKKEIGIDDDEALKRHILALQAEAYNVRDFGAPSDSF
jgi:thermostable 8-oxoguanine DNA glycosylase